MDWLQPQEAELLDSALCLIWRHEGSIIPNDYLRNDVQTLVQKNPDVGIFADRVRVPVTI
jgi:hypothetical protein